MDMYVLEFGKRRAALYNSATQSFTYYNTYEAVLRDLPQDLPKGSILIVEYAHIGCPKSEDTKQSKAQPYTAEQLLAFYIACVVRGIELRMFPQQVTYRARMYANLNPKSEENDAISMYMWLRDFPNCFEALKRPVKTFDISSETAEGWLMRAESNERYNSLRDTAKVKTLKDGSISYAKDGTPNMLGWYENPDLDVYKFIEKHQARLIAEMPDELKGPFGMDQTIKSDPTRLKAGKLKKQPISTLYHLMVDLDGSLICRPSTGQLPGKKFVRQHLIVTKPYSRRAGVAASNIKYHAAQRGWLKNRVADMCGTTYNTSPHPCTLAKEQKIEFNAHRQVFYRAINKMYGILKNIIEEEHGLKD